MKKFYLSGIFILISFFEMFAQEEYRAGQLITKSNDTLQGFILYETDANISENIKFKNELDQEAQSYRPEDLESLLFENGRIFKSINISEFKASKMLKRVLQGKVDVYVNRVKNQSKPNFYLVNNKTGKTAFLLSPKSELISDNNKSFNYKDKRFLGQIKLIKEIESNEYEEDLKYSEKRIIGNFRNYNSNYQQNYPLKEYQEEKEFTYDLSAGYTKTHDGDYAWRIAFYRNEHKIEKSKNFYIIRGVTLSSWSNKERDLNLDSGNKGSANYQRSVLTLLPWGIKYSLSEGVVQPYAYLATGLAVVLDKEILYDNGERTGDKAVLYPLPMVNLGAGLRFKINRNYLFLELTPSIDHGLFVNAGFSF